jgi:hypothetical protein
MYQLPYRAYCVRTVMRMCKACVGPVLVELNADQNALASFTNTCTVCSEPIDGDQTPLPRRRRRGKTEPVRERTEQELERAR